MGRDLFRDTSIRYFGYGREIGGLLRSHIPGNIYRGLHTATAGYVMCDTAHKTILMMRNDGRLWKVIAATGDALIWQGLASLVIPGLAINRIVFYTFRALNNTSHKGTKMQQTITTAVGMLSIPIIVTPIDRTVDFFMGITYRALFGT
ncbi:hypothetical protein JYU34_006439 [Plutella xylostella]|uniref:Mitochondrial fission process protein 1 n=2 Tax=Plutella xylostella TaxID=51655 RepID=A0A8S4GA67_PLUXY|nr:mitochondrial fission process protein 1 [Plutella xylostella]KAG7307838.1 hypothetical protein JYU34_006439 [Plutella xylostella]CAG9136567.1 unnamed protein product [Plutella xylostella]